MGASRDDGAAVGCSCAPIEAVLARLARLTRSIGASRVEIAVAQRLR
jgi:hypothetical protein